MSQLLEKCCMSLKNIEQVSSLDSMHVIMSVVKKLPINLKRAWLMLYKLNNKVVREQIFLICLNLLAEKCRIANSIFGRKTFQANYKPRRESAYVSATTKNVKDALSVAKGRCFKKNINLLKQRHFVLNV